MTTTPPVGPKETQQTELSSISKDNKVTLPVGANTALGNVGDQRTLKDLEKIFVNVYAPDVETKRLEADDKAHKLADAGSGYLFYTALAGIGGLVVDFFVGTLFAFAHACWVSCKGGKEAEDAFKDPIVLPILRRTIPKAAQAEKEYHKARDDFRTEKAKAILMGQAYEDIKAGKNTNVNYDKLLQEKITASKSKLSNSIRESYEKLKKSNIDNSKAGEAVSWMVENSLIDQENFRTILPPILILHSLNQLKKMEDPEGNITKQQVEDFLKDAKQQITVSGVTVKAADCKEEILKYLKLDPTTRTYKLDLASNNPPAVK